jgi:hypothetical protein
MSRPVFTLQNAMANNHQALHTQTVIITAGARAAIDAAVARATAESDAGAVTVTFPAARTKPQRRSKKRRARAKRASTAANKATEAPNETTASTDTTHAGYSSKHCKEFFEHYEKIQADLAITAKEMRRMEAAGAAARQRVKDYAHTMETLANLMATTALSPGPSPDDKAKNRAARRSLMRVGKSVAQARAIVGGDYDDEDARDDADYMEALELLTDDTQRKLFFTDDSE